MLSDLFCRGKGKIYLPISAPHTLGIVSKIGEQDESSKHNCLARRQFRVSTALFTDPKNKINCIKCITTLNY